MSEQELAATVAELDSTMPPSPTMQEAVAAHIGNGPIVLTKEQWTAVQRESPGSRWSNVLVPWEGEYATEKMRDEFLEKLDGSAQGREFIDLYQVEFVDG